MDQTQTLTCPSPDCGRTFQARRETTGPDNALLYECNCPYCDHVVRFAPARTPAAVGLLVAAAILILCNVVAILVGSLHVPSAVEYIKTGETLEEGLRAFFSFGTGAGISGLLATVSLVVAAAGSSLSTPIRWCLAVSGTIAFLLHVAELLSCVFSEFLRPMFQ